MQTTTSPRTGSVSSSPRECNPKPRRSVWFKTGSQSFEAGDKPIYVRDDVYCRPTIDGESIGLGKRPPSKSFTAISPLSDHLYRSGLLPDGQRMRTRVRDSFAASTEQSGSGFF